LKDGRVSFDIKLAKFDADTGLLADLVAGLVGLFTGALLGPLVGGITLAVGTVVVYEIVENIIEDDAQEEASDQAGDLREAFSSLPGATPIATTRPDPFYFLDLFIRYRYQEANTNPDGVSFAASTEVGSRPSPVQSIALVSKYRADDASSWNGLASLVYRLEDGQRITLPIGEVLKRIPFRQLATARLEVTAVRRKNCVITDLQFDTGLSLTVAEAVALQQHRVIQVAGRQLVRPKLKRPYFRDVPDGNPDDNLDQLPLF
jgi:hypothetical protein